MSNKKKNNNESNGLINNTSTGNELSKNNNDKKCCSSSSPQAEPKGPEKNSEQQEDMSSHNTPPMNKKPDNSALEEDNNPIPDPSPSADSMDPGKGFQQQSAHLVKDIILQVWHFLDGLIKVFTLCILAYTLLITKNQVGIMQDQISEMQKDRNESYKAVITANPVEENMRLTYVPNMESGRLVYEYPLTHFEKLDNMDDYPLFGISSSEKQTFTQFMFANIGPGIATRVKLSWDDKNVDRLYRTLLKLDKNASEYLKKENNYYHFNPFRLESKKVKDGVFKTTYESVEYSYMLSNREETYSVELPILYSILFSEIIIHSPLDVDPSVNLNVEFSDTQGIEYSETITLTASKSSKTPRNGSKNCHLSYTIKVRHSDPVRK